MRRALRFTMHLELPAETLETSLQTWAEVFQGGFAEQVAALFDWQPSVNQVRFFQAASQGRDVLFHVGTGGGKTVAVMLWLMAEVHRHRGQGKQWAAIVLLPTGSTLDDFVSRLHGLVEQLHQRVRILQYTAEMEPEERRRTRSSCEDADIIVMTPDMFLKTLVRNFTLGQAKGGEHERWARNLLAADAVVLEEVDALDTRALTRLRLVLRILREKTLQLFNRSFQTVATSATIPNGKEVVDALLQNGTAVCGGGRRGKIQVWIRPRHTGGEDDVLDLLLQDLLEADEARSQQFGVFWENKQGLERLAQRLHLAEHNVWVLTSDMAKACSQQRLQSFKEGHAQGLCFTSISSRSLDVAEFRTLIVVGLPPRPAELFQALGRVARNPSDCGFVYHLLDPDDPQQRDLLGHPEQLRALYEGGPPPLQLPEPGGRDIEQALAIALALGVTSRSFLDELLGPGSQRAILQHRVCGRLAYAASTYVPSSQIDEDVYEQGLRRMGKRYAVLTSEGQVVGHLDPAKVAQHALVGALLLIGQRKYRVLMVEADNVVVEPAPKELEPYLVSNQLAGNLTFSIKARRKLGPVTLGLVEVQRFWQPVTWELRDALTDKPVARGQIPRTQQIAVAERGDGLFFEDAGVPYPLQSLEFLAATLQVEAFQAPRSAVDQVTIGGRLLLAERVGGCGLLEPFFEQLPQYLAAAFHRLQQMELEEWRRFLLSAPPTGRSLSEADQQKVLFLLEAMLNGKGS